MFSDWEKPFCEKIFVPLHASEPVKKPIYYDAWALKFAVSVSWRVLTYFKRKGQISSLSLSQQKIVEEALNVWRQFLLGRTENPGSFNQHLLPVGVVESYYGPQISPFLNRYLLRGVHADIISTENSVYVYTKMCRLILFGRIQEEHPFRWDGMQLRLRRGEIRPRKYHIPSGIAKYLNHKADEAKKALESLSPKQQAIVDADFEKNIDAIANSEIFRAMQYDWVHSGEEAFDQRDIKT